MDIPPAVLYLPKLAVVVAARVALHSFDVFHSPVPQEVGWLDADIF